MAKTHSRQVRQLSQALADAVSAPAAELSYSSDAEPGISRQRRGRGFAFHWPDGSLVDDGDVLARIRKLAIPPAWHSVWICPQSGGHIQATGRDARGRKQYRYHAAWTEQRGAGKFQSLVAFGEALPLLRRRVRADLARPGLGRERVLAVVVRLLELTLIRVGNREYARTNGSYGLTTLLDDHVEAVRGRLRFRFRAKGGIERELRLGSTRLCQLVRRCQELPGQTLFQYQEDDGSCAPVTSAQVNAYLRDKAGCAVTAKHFRTWAATVMAFSTLARAERPESKAGRKRVVTATMREVSRYLGNTPSVCRNSYVHPAVVDAYEEGRLSGRRLKRQPNWHEAERETLAFLRELAGLAPGAACREGRSARTAANRRPSPRSVSPLAPARPAPTRAPDTRKGANRAA